MWKCGRLTSKATKGNPRCRKSIVFSIRHNIKADRIISKPLPLKTVGGLTILSFSFYTSNQTKKNCYNVKLNCFALKIKNKHDHWKKVRIWEIILPPSVLSCGTQGPSRMTKQKKFRLTWNITISFLSKIFANPNIFDKSLFVSGNFNNGLWFDSDVIFCNAKKKCNVCNAIKTTRACTAPPLYSGRCRTVNFNFEWNNFPEYGDKTLLNSFPCDYKQGIHFILNQTQKR